MYKRKYYFYNFITEFILIYRVASYVSNLGFFRDTDQKRVYRFLSLFLSELSLTFYYKLIMIHLHRNKVTLLECQIIRNYLIVRLSESY